MSDLIWAPLLMPHERDAIDRVLAAFEPPAPMPAPSWPAAIAELIDWFQSRRDRLPVEPFDLKPRGGVRVADPALWYRSLHADIATGPNGPRARHGAFQNDLRCLRLIISSDH